MSLRRVGLTLILCVLNAKAWSQNLNAVLFSAAAPPTGCASIAGLYPVGDRTALLWNYTKYAMVMPPYKHKQAQSFDCGGEKGTLYFFDYASAAQKDRALLFARPVLRKQQGLRQELSVREWSTGFVVVSFAAPPQDLLRALDDHLSPPGEAPVVKVSSPAASIPAPAPVPVPVQKPLPPAVKKEAPPSIEASKPAVEEETSAPFEQPKPSITAHPFEAAEATKPISAPKPPPPSPEPPKISTPREHPHPSVRNAAPAVAPGNALPAPAAGTADLSSSVIESYAAKMGCESADKNSQTQMVCGYLQEFASGLPPELPVNPDAILIGPVYTIDANGRFTDLHYDALAGSHDPSVVSYFALPSTGGKDDFEIKQLIEARKAKMPLPQNDTSAKLPALTAAKRMGLRKTAARSAILQPAADRRLYIRRAGDHLVLLGVSGATPEAQKNTSLVVVILY